MQAVQDGDYAMRYSPVHQVEIAAIKDPVERNEVKATIAQRGEICSGDFQAIRRRAETLADKGMGAADAAHVAFAEANADLFISCDDRLLKQCHRLGVTIKAMTPVAFCEQEELK